MPFGEIAAPRIPDPDDRQPPAGCLLAFRPGGRCKFRIGRYEDAQPFRLARGKTVYQVVQILVIGRCRPNRSLRLAAPRMLEAPKLTSVLTRSECQYRRGP
jgi:hypothetical protein